jgi:hypothetical protein
MTAVPVTTRISRTAVAQLRALAAQAGIGTSAYASRLLETLLLGREIAGAQHGLSAEVQELLAVELVFVARSLERVLAKQTGVIEELRRDAKSHVASLMATSRSAQPISPLKPKTAARPDYAADLKAR